MGRRKKTDTVIDAVQETPAETSVADALVDVTPAAPTDPVEFIPPSLKEAERLTLKLAESEAQRYSIEANFRLLQRENLLRKLDPDNQLGKLETEARSAVDRAQQAKRRYAQTVQNIEERLNLKMSDYSFDDETGTLIPH